MGKSNSISQQQKDNQEFQDYIDKQTAALDTLSTDAQQQIADKITKYYSAGSWDDQKPLISGSYTHLATASEWSLDNVSKMIDSIKGAIFGSNPAPDGSTKALQDENLASTVAKMGDMDLLIASAAFNAIQGILSAFASSTKTSIQKDYVVKELAPGLTMFLCIIDNEYSRSDFFGGETICQTGYIFDTRFSIKQAGDIANFNQVNMLMAEQETQETIASKCNTALKTLDVTNDNYDAQSAKYTKIQDSCNDRVDALKEKIDALKSGAKKQVQPA